MNAAIRRRFWFIIAALICGLAMGVVAATAQADPIPIAIGENQIGELSDPAATALYSLTITSPQNVQVQALAISPGLAPMLRILDPLGIVVFDALNSGAQSTVQGAPFLASSGAYVIQVSSANGVAGQFLLSVQASALLTPPQPLVLGERVEGTVSSQQTRQGYTFSVTPSDGLLLNVETGDSPSGAVIVLHNAQGGDTLAVSSAQLGGVRYRIRPGTAAYLLDVLYSGGDTAQPYAVCLETENGTVSCAEGVVPPVQTEEVVVTASPIPTAFPPTTDPNGACAVTPADAAINVRSGPGTNYPVVGALLPSSSAPVFGRSPDNLWFQINASSVIGWVSASVVNLTGNCAGVPVVQPPTLPPTAPFTATSPAPPSPSLPTPTQTTTPSSTVAPTINPLLLTPRGRDSADLTIELWGTPIINGATYLDVRILNQGTANVGAFNVNVCVIPEDVSPCQTSRVPSLQGNGGRIVTFSFGSLYRGVHPVIATVDAGGEVFETNESNNIATGDMDFH
jgi:hypothetical protein